MSFGGTNATVSASMQMDFANLSFLYNAALHSYEMRNVVTVRVANMATVDSPT